MITKAMIWYQWINLPGVFSPLSHVPLCDSLLLALPSVPDTCPPPPSPSVWYLVTLLCQEPLRPAGAGDLMILSQGMSVHCINLTCDSGIISPWTREKTEEWSGVTTYTRVPGICFLKILT